MKSDAGQAGRHRRHHDRAFKAKLIEQCLAPGASVSAIALEHGINANMLFKWRRQASGAGEQPVLLPVHVAPDEAQQGAPRSAARCAPAEGPASSSVIELEIAGAKLRLRGGVHEDSLRKVLRALRETA